jgi:hypothetical protein
MDNNQNPQDGNINIELNEMVAAGVYANLALVNHSPSEFVVDFIQLMPGVQQAKVRSRVILLHFTLKELLMRFSKTSLTTSNNSEKSKKLSLSY